MRRNYFCIHCGHTAPAILKVYGEQNLVKLIECEHCGQLVDKFVEYDLIIVIINLILQDETAYRHLLLNSELKNYWKLGLFFLIIQSYCFWCFHKGAELHSKNETYYQLETNFYQSLFRSIVNVSSLHALVILTALLTYRFRPATSFSCFSLWKGMIIAGYSELFELCRLVWSYSTDSPRMYFHEGLLIMSITFCFKVVNGVSKTQAFVSVLMCWFIQKFLIAAYDSYFPITAVR